MATPVPVQSAPKPYTTFPLPDDALYMKFDHICPTDIRDKPLWKYKQTMTMEEEMGGWGTPDDSNINIFTCAFCSAVLKRQLRRQMVL